MSAEPSTAQRAYQFIRDKLEAGDLRPGTRLVTRDIAKEIGSSLNPVREALSRLATEGLVAHVPGAGASVRHADRQEIRELYAVREALESFAAAEAVRSISVQELDALSRIVDDWKLIASRLEETGSELDDEERVAWRRSNERFHEILVEAARNRILTKIVTDYRVLATIFGQHQRLAIVVDAKLARQVADGHEELLSALRQRDGAAAHDQVASLIRIGCDTVLRRLDDDS